MTFSYSLSELVRDHGVTARALRLYDDMGLIRAMRDKANSRRYCPEERDRLVLLLELRRIGLSLQEIREILNAEAETQRQLALDAVHRRTEMFQRYFDEMVSAAEFLRATFESPQQLAV